jgi:hypothetical protein
MLRPSRFPSLFHSSEASSRALMILVFVLAVALIVSLSVRHAPYAAAAVTGPLPANVERSATELNWRQSPSSSLSSTGRNSVTLSPCPPGVIGSEPAYYVYITGAGTPEAARVTGGTCKGDDRPGTLEFTTMNSHPAGYILTSASGGIQEASIAARYHPTNVPGNPQSGRVTVPPGEYDVYAPISIRASNQTIDFAGSILDCYTPNDACIFVGDPKSSNVFENITLIGPRGRSMTVAGVKPFIEVNGEQTRIFNVTTAWPSHGTSFGSYIQVDDDQAFLLDGLDTGLGGGGVTCNPTFCGAVISAPGPFNRWSAVGWFKHLNLSLQCSGKGIEWISGNSLRVTDSVIQGWSVFAIRVSSQRGGYAGLTTDNVYFEASPSCKTYSPYGNVGSAAIIDEGVQIKIGGMYANGPGGVFPNWGADSGSHDWLYWVAPVSAKFGEGVPLPAGHARTNGSTAITGVFPRIAGASSYKILKADWDGGTPPRPYPEGSGKYLLTTIQQSSCGTLTCQFTDRGETLSSYTNVGEDFSKGIYMPRLDFWPGGIVVSSADDMSSGSYSVPALAVRSDVLTAGGVVGTWPSWIVGAEADTLMASPATPTAAVNIDALHTNAIGPFPGATIMKAANLPSQAPSGHKGRLNFGHRGQTDGFTPLITLGDSEWGKTWATAGHRPKADVNDLDLGYEGNIDVLYSRAQNEVREYVGKFPDGKPQERLTASDKTFNVPVTVNGNLTITGKCVGCGGDGGGPSRTNTSRWTVSLTGQKAAISTTNLCASTACGSGQYRISYYLDSVGSCASPGNAAAGLTIAWKDETGTRTLRVPLSGIGISNSNTLGLGQPANFGGGDISVWSSGSGITYSTNYAACANGVGAYSLRIALERVP